MTEIVNDDGDADLQLWRALLEVDLAVEERDDSDWDDELDLASQERVFSRIGMSDAPVAPEVVVRFVVDVEAWLAHASPQAALARDLGSIAETLEVSIPSVAAAGFGDTVEFECDMDGEGRISELAVLLIGARGPGLDLVLIDGRRQELSTAVSRFGLARFTKLQIDPRESTSLSFELRQRHGRK